MPQRGCLQQQTAITEAHEVHRAGNRESIHWVAKVARLYLRKLYNLTPDHLTWLATLTSDRSSDRAVCYLCGR